jgi:hypothetical protein
MKLAIHPLLQAHRLDFLRVAGTRTERQPVQGLQDFLIVGNLFEKLPGLPGILLFIGGLHSGECSQ